MSPTARVTVVMPTKWQKYSVAALVFSVNAIKSTQNTSKI